MKIIVCLKQVPKNDSILRLNESLTWIQEKDLTYEINESDAYALEAALQLKEKNGGEVIALSLGPARIQSLILEALARGADRALHLEDTVFEELDAYATAAVIAAAAQAEGFDLLLTGLQSDDKGFAQTGVIAAEILGLPHATIVMEILSEGETIKVKRELEAGYFQYVSMSAPAVLSIQSGINTLRYATLKGIMGAKKKEVKKMNAEALNLDAALLMPKQQIKRVYLPSKAKQTVMIEGSAAEAAAILVDKLKNEVRVL